MRVFVINCQRHAERRAAAQSKLEKAGVRFEFFNGLCAEDALERELFDAIDEHEFLLNTGRKVTDGEIGCFASHREIWKRAAQLNESVVIMEDDFESRHHDVTTIDGRRKTAKPLPVAARRFSRKAGWYMKRWHFNWQHRAKIANVSSRQALPGNPY